MLPPSKSDSSSGRSRRSEQSDEQARPRRRGTKTQTRERLLQAALELLHSGGDSAVTTVSVTRLAGVVQSMFYQHFTCVEECLAHAAEQVTTHIREAVAVYRRHIYDTTEVSREDLEAGFRAMFALVERQRALIQLFLRHRCNPLAFEGVMYRLARGLSTDLAGQLLSKYGDAGLNRLPVHWVESLAEDLVAISLSALESHLEGRGSNVDETASRLAACSTAMVVALIQQGLSLPSS